MIRDVVLLTVALVASACAPGDIVSTPAADAPAADATAADEEACPAIDLRTAAGDRIDLNGTWETELEGIRAGIYFFRQIRSCVWFAGGFPKPSDTDLPGPMGYVTVVFHGRVSTDFRVSGEWADVRDQLPVSTAGRGGILWLTIETDDAGRVRLVYAGGEGASFVEPGYRESQRWVKISDRGAYPPP